MIGEIMKISEIIKHLEYQKNTYGDSEIMISLNCETESGNEAIVTKSGNLCFTYFQVNKDKELLIIGD